MTGQRLGLSSIVILLSVCWSNAIAQAEPDNGLAEEFCEDQPVDPLMPRAAKWEPERRCKAKPPVEEFLPPEYHHHQSLDEVDTSQHKMLTGGLEDLAERHASDPTSPVEKVSEMSDDLDNMRKANLYCHRFIKAVLYHVGAQDAGVEVNLRMIIDADDVAVLLKSVDEDVAHADDAFEVLAESLHRAEAEPRSTPDYDWMDHYHTGILTTIFQVVLIVFMVLIIFYIIMALWMSMGPKTFSIILVFLIFWTCVPWTYVHLYKKELAKRIQRSTDGITDQDCQQPSIYAVLFSNVDKKCERYYQDVTIDALWEVKPTQALAVTFVQFVWEPLAIMGEPLGKFIHDFLEPLPWWLKPIILVLAIILAALIVTINSGIRISSWFFTIETANTAQYQLTAINRSIEDVRALVSSTNNTYQRRDDQVTNLLSRLDRQLERRDDLNEMLPVLDRFCSEYAHQEAVKMRNNPAAGDAYRAATLFSDAIVVPEQEVMSFTIRRPDHIVLTTSQPDKVIDFYQRLGFESRNFGDGRKALHIAQFKINIHQLGSEISPHANNATTGSLDICLVCASRVQTTLTHIQAKNIKIELGPVPRTGAMGPITSVYVRDPDNNLIELAHYNNTATAAHINNLGSTREH